MFIQNLAPWSKTIVWSCNSFWSNIASTCSCYVSWGLTKWKIQWRNWKDLAIPKSEGGMGFRDLTLFNQVVQDKKGWRLITKPDSLCARVLWGKYTMILNSCRQKGKVMHHIHGMRFFSGAKLWRRVDYSIRIWDDPWIPSNTPWDP
jgi:hypothetical protein